MTVRLSPEVRAAIAYHRPVVALESTLLSHGLPNPRNLDVARRAEALVREHGAVPATVAVLSGEPVVGLTADELERICDPDRPLEKLSHRDLALASVRKSDGATTVASTMTIARTAGIDVFATGGIGGVHRGAAESYDISADIDVLAHTPVVVVCSGVKSMLDVGATLELLESRSVPVVGYRTDRFPAFYIRDSGYAVPARLERASEVAAMAQANWSGVSPTSALVVACPIPEGRELDRGIHDSVLVAALDEVDRRGVRGKDVTPALLAYFHARTQGASLDANEALVLANVAVAAEIAVAMVESET